MMKNIAQSHSFCGEAPIRDPRTGELFWVDTGKKECWKIDPESEESNRIPTEGCFQALGKRERGGWIAPLDDRLVLCDDNLKIIQDLGNPTKEKPYMLLGDGTSGPDGCYYYTIYHPEELTSKEGAILKVNRDLSVEMVLTDLALPNGIAFSPDDKKLYVTEMFGNCIWQYDFNSENGEFSNKELFAEVPEVDGYPDGLIVDSNGNVLSAHWQGFRITRYQPDGSVDRIIESPVPTATCMAFGGKDLKTLYATTARKGCTDEQLEKYPESGDLFAVEMDIPGIPERIFKG
ncbi:MAG: SMP-30/gluconolactonase/LRE family protein [Spirochaetales bacterium]|nr:SMP-30/gluconolactonase/LRE family protein [Spirochaetales bacterium]